MAALKARSWTYDVWGAGVVWLELVTGTPHVFDLPPWVAEGGVGVWGEGGHARKPCRGMRAPQLPHSAATRSSPVHAHACTAHTA
jgi:hypothetical protein